MTQYRVLPGPEHFLPPAAASMGIYLPNPGEAHINGVIVPEEKAYEEAARQFLMAQVPTIFPGPLVLWAWNEKAAKKAAAVRKLYENFEGIRSARTKTDADPHAGLSSQISENQSRSRN